MIIRPETKDDIPAIAALTNTAFADIPHSDGCEPAIVDALRMDGDLAVSLVAENAAALIGHVAFSPVTIGQSRGFWFGLGPISVAPEHQRQGVGRALIVAGHAALRDRSAAGCVLIGDPGYYGQHGYANDGRISYQNLDSQYVQWIAFGVEKPTGEVVYSAGFNAP